jgi:uncharacterized protein (DUF433 family)
LAVIRTETYNPGMANVFAEHIEIAPGICGGRPRIAGSRVRVQDVAVLHERLGRSPDEIVAAYPSVSLADVHAALAYYFDHCDEIRRMIADDEAYAADLKNAMPSKLVRPEPGQGASISSR